LIEKLSANFVCVTVPPVPTLPAPPTPPEVIVTEQDRQMVIAYEQWLGQQHQALTAQLKTLETEVNKLRKVKKVC
jgi:hypothetical protein